MGEGGETVIISDFMNALTTLRSKRTFEITSILRLRGKITWKFLKFKELQICLYENIKSESYFYKFTDQTNSLSFLGFFADVINVSPALFASVRKFTRHYPMYSLPHLTVERGDGKS